MIKNSGCKGRQINNRYLSDASKRFSIVFKSVFLRSDLFKTCSIRLKMGDIILI